MTFTRIAACLLALLLSGSLTACTSTSTGDPRPANTSTTTSAETSRPREIKLDGIDPCALLPEADYADYDLDKPGKPGTTKRGEPECVWNGDAGFLGAVLVTYEGVDAQKGKLGKVQLTDPINEFPAYTVVLPDTDVNICAVLVDVADGQYLDVQAGVFGDRPGIPPACEYAHQFATSVMSTLVAS